MFRAIFLSICVAFTVPLAGCVDGGIASPDTVSSNLPILTIDEAVYSLGPGDRIGVSLYSESTLGGEFVINPEGTISFPLIGAVQAGGMSVAEFTSHLEDRLRDGYLRDPRATVAVLNYRPYYLIGEVNSPGTYPYSSGLTVYNAVAIAGGFSYRAARTSVFIKHADQDSEIQYALTTVTPVQPGDTIRIQERRF